MVEEAKPSNLSTGKKRLSHRGRQISLQVVVGMIILICGIVIGWGAAVLQLKDKMMMPPGPRPPTREVVEDMEARYDLTPEQAKQVEVAFGKRRETLQTLFEEFRSKSEAEFQKLSADIKKILTPEQYERWEQDFKRRRRPEPWERGPGRPGDRGPGPGGPGDRGPGRGFGERGPGPMRPPPEEPVEEKPGSDSAGLSEPNSTNRGQYDFR
jgi:hypothetical protein